MSELIERLRNVWDNLSAREQILVGTAGGILAISLFVFAVVMPFFAVVEGAQTRVQTAEQSLMAMVRLQREYAEIDRRLSTVESRIQNQGSQQNLRTLLDTLARESAVRIASMEERQASKNDQYVETKVEVALKNVSLSQTVKYLHNIEASSQPLSIKNLRIRTRPDDNQLLDVTFSVSSFEPT